MRYKFFTKLTLWGISFFVLSSFFMSCDRNIAVTGVSLDKQNLTLEVGQKKPLTAVITPVEATNQNMTWSSRNTNIATVNETGVVKAVSPGKTIITVTTEDGGFTAFCSVTVIDDGDDDDGDVVKVTDVLLDRNKCIMGVGQQFTLVATVIPDSATNKSVTWSSENTGVATVDETGTVTAVAVGKTIITVTTQQNHKTATCEVEVSKLENIAIYFDPKFAAKLKEKGYINDAYFFTADVLSNIEELNIDETRENKNAKGITSIKGISYFTALKILSCRNNNLDSLGDMTQTQMNQLTKLIVSGNNFSSLYLPCSDLDTFCCQNNNNLTTLHIGPGEHLLYLKYIDCSNCKLTELNTQYVNNGKNSTLICSGNPGKNGSFYNYVYWNNHWKVDPKEWIYNGQTVTYKELGGIDYPK